MPHFDDVAFFDTRDYEHRGGIWADAGRKRTELDTPVAPGPVVVDDDVPIAHAGDEVLDAAVNGVDGGLLNGSKTGRVCCDAMLLRRTQGQNGEAKGISCFVVPRHTGTSTSPFADRSHS